MPKGHSTTNEQKRKAAKAKARERKNRRANHVLTRNTSKAERARRRGESTVETTRRFLGWNPPEGLAERWTRE